MYHDFCFIVKIYILYTHVHYNIVCTYVDKLNVDIIQGDYTST